MSRGAGRGNVWIDNDPLNTSVVGTATVTFATPDANVRIYNQHGAAVYQPTVTAQNNLIPINASIPFGSMVASGYLPKYIPWTKLGTNNNVGTSQETVWSYSSEYSFITTAGQIEVVSDNAQDTATTGTGAWTVSIKYLKSDYSESSMTLSLAGLTPVASGASHADVWRVNSFRIMTAGTNNACVGNLTLRQVVGGKVVSYISAGKTRARNTVYTVPLNYELLIYSCNYSAVGVKYMTFTNHANYENFSGTILQRGMFMPYTEAGMLNNSYYMEFIVPTRLPATVDLKVSVTAEAAGSTAIAQLRGALHYLL